MRETSEPVSTLRPVILCPKVGTSTVANSGLLVTRWQGRNGLGGRLGAGLSSCFAARYERGGTRSA